MDEERIRQIIREEMSKKLGYIFSGRIQILDGRNIQTGLTTGTQIGTAAAQKIALHGVSPTIQSLKINDPDAMSGTYVQAEQVKQNDAIKNIIDCLEAKGLSASS